MTHDDRITNLEDRIAGLEQETATLQSAIEQYDAIDLPPRPADEQDPRNGPVCSWEAHDPDTQPVRIDNP